MEQLEVVISGQAKGGYTEGSTCQNHGWSGCDGMERNPPSGTAVPSKES